MSLNDLLQGWTGIALRHVPADPEVNVLDFRFAGAGKENRWNVQGQRTLYLAGDIGVVITEWGRHFSISRTLEFGERNYHRKIYEIGIALESVIDLRIEPAWRALSLGDAPACFLEIERARAVARQIRISSSAQAMIVPPMAHLDQPDRWCLVVFLDKLPDDPSSFITSVNPLGSLRIG